MLVFWRISRADLVRQTGISEQTIYRWKKQYAGLESTQSVNCRALRGECAAEKAGRGLSLDKAVLQDVLSKKFPGQRSMKQVVAYGPRITATASDGPAF
jgi:putative transposase